MEQIDIVNVQNHFIALLNDNIVKSLLKESHITKTQLKTIYIDILAPNIPANIRATNNIQRVVEKAKAK